MPIEVIPVFPVDFERVYPLLLDFRAQRMSREDWRRMLFVPPWNPPEPHRGFALRDGDRLVGFLGTLFSRRMIDGQEHSICNLSSWIVMPSHRQESLRLMRPIQDLKGYTVIALTPSAAAHAVYRRMGFLPLESAQVLVPPWPGSLGVSVHTKPQAIRHRLDDPGRRIFDDLSGTLAGQILLQRGGRFCHVVATRSAWKPWARLAHLQYASDWSFVLRHLGDVHFGLFRVLRTLGLRIDRRHIPGPLPIPSVTRSLPLPDLYRPAEPELSPSRIDGLYTERVGLRA